MKSWKIAAATMIAIGSVVGCDDKSADDKKPAAAVPGASPGIMDKMNDAGATAKDKATEMKDSAVSTATDAKNATADKATDMKNSAVSAAGDAKATLVAQAQQYYDKAKEMINAKNFAGAGDMVSKLQGLKAQLPAEWASKIDDLQAYLDKAKAAVGNMMPATTPKP